MQLHPLFFMLGSLLLGGAGIHGENPILVFAAIAFVASAALSSLTVKLGPFDNDEDINIRP